jgi:hypothetical protein
MVACDLDKFPMPILAHYTLARAVYEPSLHTLWLLDVNATSRDRIGRGYAMELQSLHDMRKFQDAVKPSEANAQVLIDRVLDGAAADGFVALDRNGERKLTVPMRNMVDLFNDYDGPEIPDRKPEWRYRMLSGLTHGRRWAVVGSAAEVETATDEGYLIRPNWQLLQHFAEYAARIASRAVAAVVEYRYEPSALPRSSGLQSGRSGMPVSAADSPRSDGRRMSRISRQRTNSRPGRLDGLRLPDEEIRFLPASAA